MTKIYIDKQELLDILLSANGDPVSLSKLTDIICDNHKTYIDKERVKYVFEKLRKTDDRIIVTRDGIILKYKMKY